MLRRCLLLLSLVFCAALLLPPERVEAAMTHIRSKPEDYQLPFGDDGIVCVSDLVWRNADVCPPYGPATTAARVANIRLPGSVRREAARIGLTASQQI